VPFRRLGVAVAVAIVLLAIAGFVYGKVRSRVPAPRRPKPAIAGPAPIAGQGQTPVPPGATPLPPPMPIALPPPAVEDAVADTVIFEPPSTHETPHVIALPGPDTGDDEPAEVVGADPGETEATSPDAEQGTETTGPAEAWEAPDRG
jgi:hypothetical protein